MICNLCWKKLDGKPFFNLSCVLANKSGRAKTSHKSPLEKLEFKPINVCQSCCKSLNEYLKLELCVNMDKEVDAEYADIAD